MAEQRSVSKRQGMSLAAWDAIRPRFTTLYLVEKRTLPQIMSILAEEGFHGTIKQFKDRIRKWSLHKNVKASLKDKILDQLLASARPELPLETSYSFGGVSIPAHKLVRYAKAKNMNLPPQILTTRGSDGIQPARTGFDIPYSQLTLIIPPGEDSSPSQLASELELQQDLAKAAIDIWTHRTFLLIAELISDFVRLFLDGSFSHLERSHGRRLIAYFKSMAENLVESLSDGDAIRFLGMDMAKYCNVAISEDSELFQDLMRDCNDNDQTDDNDDDRLLQWALTHVPTDIISFVKACCDIRSIEAELNRTSQEITLLAADAVKMTSDFENGLLSLKLDGPRKRISPAASLHNLHEVIGIVDAGGILDDLLAGAWYILPLHPSLPLVICDTGEPVNKYLADPVLFDAENDENYLDASVPFVSDEFQGLASRIALRPLHRPALVDANFVAATSPSPSCFQLDNSMDISWGEQTRQSERVGRTAWQ